MGYNEGAIPQVRGASTGEQQSLGAGPMGLSTTGYGRIREGELRNKVFQATLKKKRKKKLKN